MTWKNGDMKFRSAKALPWIFVAAPSELPLIANRISGNSIGNTISARCR